MVGYDWFRSIMDNSYPWYVLGNNYADELRIVKSGGKERWR